MGKYDFDTVYLRPHQGSSKWDGALRQGCPPDVVPLSVADMEFPSAPEIREALEETAKAGFWGYTYGTPELQAAIQGWMLRRHGWRVETEWMVHTAGVVTAFYAAVRAFTEPGDRVLIQPPVYHPFFGAIRQNGREVLENPLLCEDGVYTMDLEDLERKLPQAKMMILCSPHNPVGRVWTREELLAVGELCRKNRVLLFVDEIHSDLILGPRKHTAFGTLPSELLENCIIGTAASKTFSLAGLGCSTIFLPNPRLREKYEEELGKSACHFNSTFGVAATRTAYEKCEPWLEELLEVLRGNYRYLKDFMARHFPRVTVSPLEGTYLAWVDFNSLGLSPEALEKFMQQEAKLYLNEGYVFGRQGAGFERINLACPRKVLEDSLNRLKAAAERL